MSHCPSLLEIRDLRVDLGGKPILRGVTADILRGKTTALIGLNGAGKTTLLRALLKEVPYRGAVKFNCGHDHSQPFPTRIGYVPQKLQVDARLPLTVRDLLALALQKRPLFLGVSRKAAAEMDRLIADVRMTPALLDRPVERISGGELQRVLLGLALRPEPELLLLDEPAAGIDFKDQDRFYELIADVNRKRGVTIVLVSHELSVVSNHADHVLCLKDGRVECQGSPREILTREVLSQTFGTDTAVYTHHHYHQHGPPARPAP
jgi:zinc transport system ATP-binding protein